MQVDIYNIPYKRPSEPQRQVGRNWGGRKNNWKKIVPGKRHILIPENEGYVPPKPKRKKRRNKCKVKRSTYYILKVCY